MSSEIHPKSFGTFEKQAPGDLGIRVFGVFLTLAYGILLSQYGYKVFCFAEVLVFGIETRVTVFTILSHYLPAPERS